MLFIIKMAVKLLQLLLLSREPENHDVHLDAKKKCDESKNLFSHSQLCHEYELSSFLKDQYDIVVSLLSN